MAEQDARINQIGLAANGGGGEGKTLGEVNSGSGPPPTAGHEGNPEIYFLIADFLSRNSPCQEAAQGLIAEMEAKGLLGTKLDWRCPQGGAPPCTYHDMRRRYDELPGSHLATILRDSLGGGHAATIARGAPHGASQGASGSAGFSGAEAEGPSSTIAAMGSLSAGSGSAATLLRCRHPYVIEDIDVDPIKVHASFLLCEHQRRRRDLDRRRAANNRSDE